MGCVCSKGSKGSEKDFTLENHVKGKQLKANKSSRLLGSSLRREEAAVDGDGGTNEAMTRLISDDPREDNLGSTPPSDYAEKNVINIEKPSKPQLQRHSTMQSTPSGELVRPKVSRIATITNGERGAQVVAGWPSWLTSVAGEAINGWVPRRADSFEKLEKIGQGTYSSVYKARDLDTNKMVALKKVRFANMDPESVRFMAREILILRRLDHPNVMKLEGLITSRVSGSLYLIFEYMEHDLAGLIAMPGFKFTESQIKCYMQQLLRGLEHCHNQGVLHRDVKGSNLLINNDGNLKIGDFGLATFFHSPQKQPLTSRVVTLWYRPPELLLGATDYGVSVDLWSTGCILAELLAGKPIMPGRTEVEQLHKIFKLCGSPSEEYWKKSKLPHATIFKPQHPYRRVVSETFSNFSSSALALLDVLLAIEPDDRGTASFALQNEYFTTRPLPSDPSTLPKYPPSKELDAKLREEEARRQKAAVGVSRDRDPNRKSTKESRAVPAPDANAELQASINKRQGHSNPKSMSEKFAPEEDGGSGFPIEPPRGAAINVFSHSGQLMHPSAFGSSQNTNVNEGSSLRDVGSIRAAEVELRSQRSYMHRGSSQLSRFSNSVAIRGNSQFDSVRESAGNPHWPEERFSSRYNHLNGGEISENHDWARHLLDKPKLLHKKDEQQSGKEPAMGHLLKKNRIHFSGPLMPANGNLDEMLKEHEKQIQHSVRKARLDKAKTKKTSIDNGQAQSLLLHQR